jgi:TetR/AcrR family transcriptional regulator, transcriptional repressor for nem operon
MREKTRHKQPKTDAREKLVEASFELIRQKGYADTSVDELCAKAGVTKGAFFHHFRSKDELALAAAKRWSEGSMSLFQAAPYHKHADPLDRVFGYLDFRKSMLKGEVVEFSCLIGTMLQEIHETHAEIRKACEASLSEHAALVEVDIAAAMKAYDVRAQWSAQSLALYVHAVLQGAFILAKGKGGPEVAVTSVDHLRRYIELLFDRQAGKKPRRARARRTSSASTDLPSSTRRSGSYPPSEPVLSSTASCLRARLRQRCQPTGRDLDARYA